MIIHITGKINLC